MQLCDLTLDTPEANLACDEALLDACDAGALGEVLRFWESTRYFVVVGYANRVAREVQLEVCKAAGVPVFRRCSGGGTVVQGKGCLNFSLILRLTDSPLEQIHRMAERVLQCHQKALQPLMKGPVETAGISDLTWKGLKFSGNAQRLRRKAVLFHGTFLIDFDLSRVSEWLHMPSVEPDYRHKRPHLEFLTNLGVDGKTIKGALRKAWNAEETLHAVPLDHVQTLVRDKYSTADWNHRL